MDEQETFLHLHGIHGSAKHPQHQGWLQVDLLSDMYGGPNDKSPTGYLYGFTVNFREQYNCTAMFENAKRYRRRFPSGRLVVWQNSQLYFQDVLGDIEVVAVSSYGKECKCVLKTTTLVFFANYLYRRSNPGS